MGLNVPASLKEYNESLALKMLEDSELNALQQSLYLQMLIHRCSHFVHYSQIEKRQVTTEKINTVLLLKVTPLNTMNILLHQTWHIAAHFSY